MDARHLNAGDELVLASHNKGKIVELEEMLRPYNINVTGGPDFNLEEPEENGLTFIENSQIKSFYFASHTQKIALADDSGLVIPALDGQPGIYSARWAGEDKDFTVAFERIKKEFEERDVQMEGQEAYFVCAISVTWPDGYNSCFEGRVYGTLVAEPRGEKGFGYDPIFVPDGESKTFAELDASIKSSMSHRAKAMEMMFDAVVVQRDVG